MITKCLTIMQHDGVEVRRRGVARRERAAAVAEEEGPREEEEEGQQEPVELHVHCDGCWGYLASGTCCP